MSDTQFDLIVIGAGPGGYVAAIKAAQLGFKTACVEREFLGGTCLNVGCIPSKALLDSSERYYTTKNQLAKHGISFSGEVKLDLTQMMARKTEVVNKMTGGVGFLFKKNKIEHLKGEGKIVSAGEVSVKSADGSTKSYSTKRILIATGSAPIEIPGFKFDEKMIVSSTGALAIPTIPKKMVLVGAGYIGMELGSVWARLGTDVLVLEFLERALPLSDKEMAGALQKSLEKQGLKFKFNTVAESAEVVGDKVKVKWKSKDGTQNGMEEVDRVVVCVGRKPVVNNLGLEKVGVQIDKKGYVVVDEHYATNVPGIYAIGDVIGGVMLAHKAEEEGIAAVEIMAGKAGHVNYAACPSVIYTHPELAQVGLSEEEAAKRGPIKVGKFPFLANGRAVGMAESEGFVKVIGDARTDKILGVHIFAAHASDMIAEAVLAIEFAASCEDLARTFHAHPTLPEALKEAAMNVDKMAIHI